VCDTYHVSKSEASIKRLWIERERGFDLPVRGRQDILAPGSPGLPSGCETEKVGRERLSTVRWETAGRMLTAWLLTIPAAGAGVAWYAGICHPVDRRGSLKDEAGQLAKHLNSKMAHPWVFPLEDGDESTNSFPHWIFARFDSKLEAPIQIPDNVTVQVEAACSFPDPLPLLALAQRFS
jgi:hypothetical protein